MACAGNELDGGVCVWETNVGVQVAALGSGCAAAGSLPTGMNGGPSGRFMWESTRSGETKGSARSSLHETCESLET